MWAYSSGKIIELERRLNPSDNTLTANIDVGVTSEDSTLETTGRKNGCLFLV